MQSKATLGEALGINPTTIENKLSRLSCCLSHCDRIAHSRLIQTMVAHSARLLMFVDLCRYDATPLPIGVDQHLDDVLHYAGLLDSADVLATARGRTVSTPAPITIGKTSSRTHLLDSEHRYAMLVQIGQPGALKYMAFIGQSLTWLQLTDRSTAEAEKAAIMETSITSRDADAFEMKARVCTTDGAS